MNSELDAVCEKAIKTLEEKNISNEFVFDEFCAQVDEWCQPQQKQAYIRVFWYEELGESTIEEMLNEICEVYQKFEIESYSITPSDIFEACFMVLTYKETRNVYLD